MRTREGERHLCRTRLERFCCAVVHWACLCVLFAHVVAWHDCCLLLSFVVRVVLERDRLMVLAFAVRLDCWGMHIVLLVFVERSISAADSTGCSLCSSRSLPVHVLRLYSWGLVCSKSSCAMISNEWVLCVSPMMVVPAVAGAGRATCFFLLPVCWCASPSVGVRRAWGNVNVYRGNIKSTAGSVEPPGSHSRQCQGAAAAIRQQHHVHVGDLSLVCIILQLAWAGDSEMFFIARMDRDVDLPEAVPSKSSSINIAAATIRWESVRS